MVQLPFAKKPESVGSVVTADSWDDLSPDAIEAVVALADERGVDIDGVSWRRALNAKSLDDDGWCMHLSSLAFRDFDDLFSQKSGKPKKYMDRDNRTGYDERGIMSVSHPGCSCYLMVSLDDGSVYKVTTTESEPAMVVPPSAEEEET